MTLTTPRRPRNPSHSGRALEALVIASQTTVTLTQVKQAALRTRKGVIAVRGPCDFFGCFKSDGRLLVFDCKESDNPNLLETRESHLSEHQRLELLRYADAGAVAGVLALCRPTGNLYWIAASALHPRPASVPWTPGAFVGKATMAVNWMSVRDTDRAWNSVVHIGRRA